MFEENKCWKIEFNIDVVEQYSRLLAMSVLKNTGANQSIDHSNFALTCRLGLLAFAQRPNLVQHLLCLEAPEHLLWPSSSYGSHRIWEQSGPTPQDANGLMASEPVPRYEGQQQTAHPTQSCHRNG
jgi:hypothetical protein